MADDEFAAFNLQPPPAKADEFAAFNLQPAPAQGRVAEGFSALEDKPEGESIPHAFIDRIATGALVMRDMFGYSFDLGKAAGKYSLESTAEQAHSINDRLNPFSDAYQAGRESGAWTGPGTFIGVGKGVFDTATLPLAPAGGAMTELIAQPYSKITGMPLEDARAAVGKALLGMRPGSGNTPTFSRSVKQGEVVRDEQGLISTRVLSKEVREQAIGPLPTPADFKTGAQVMTGYHGSPVPFTEFSEKGPYYFSPHPDVASNYALATQDQVFALRRGENPDMSGNQPHVARADLRMEKPFEADVHDYENSALARDPEWLRKNGYDSAILRDAKDPKATEYMVLDRSQIGPKLSGKAAKSAVVEENLRRLWNDDGVHPAEAVHDAQADAFVKHDLTTAAESIEVPAAEAEVLREAGVVPARSAPSLDERLSALDKERDSSPKYISGSDDPFSGALDAATKVSLSDATQLERHIRWSLEHGRDDIAEAIVQRAELNAERARDAKPGVDPSNADRYARIEASLAAGAEQAATEAAALRALLPEARPHSLGAAVTTEPPIDTPLSVQPASPPGALLSAGRAAVDQLYGLGRNIQFMLDPMATGSNRAMAIAKDAMNSVRRIRWDHARIDAEAVKTFEPEARARMWNAADEESVALQLGESREHQGLITLEPNERAFIEDAHARAQSAWLNAVDTGIVDGDGLPAYTPRMVMNVAAASSDMAPRALNELGRNVFTRTAQMNRRGYMTAEETEAAAKRLVGQRMAERGASMDEINAALEKVKIARDIRALPLATARLQEATVWRDMINKVEDVGKQTGSETVAVGYKPDNSWFTIAGNPAFTKWEPLLEKGADGKFMVKMDQDGNPIMAPKPIYMHPEFRGPMTSILDESANKSKVEMGAQSLYGGLMALKGKSMTAILNSPLIHNEVVWSKVMEAAGGREWLGFNLYFKGNRIVNGNPARAGELIERGLNPMGPRGSFQDITSMMEQPNIESRYHTSWTGKIAGFIPGLFDASAGTAVEAAIAKAGNFFHNTLLWDRVRDVQFGLADHLSDRLVGKGVDRLTADRVSSHFSNIIVGSIPKEAMSAAARATANMLLFSRSFTLGNLSTFKQAAMGLPKPILAQIERDLGVSATEAVPEAAQAEISQTATSIARRKAVSTIAMSAGLYYVGNALIQHAFNIATRDSNLNDEMQGYARRYQSLMNDVKTDPFELRHLIGRLSPTYDNEPAKQDRAHIGYDKDGSAIYARNPTGKFGEEMVGYPTMPMSMVRRKLSPLAGGILDILENDRGFGRKIYDENDRTVGGDVATAVAVAKHLVMKHLPEGQITAAVDLMRGDGDPTMNKLRLVSPALGFTVSGGAPGGMARGEQLAAKQQFDARFGLAWPDIKKQIQRGDVDGARSAMDNIQVPPQMQKGLIRNATDPSSALHGRTLKNFYQSATPEQIDRMERVR